MSCDEENGCSGLPSFFFKKVERNPDTTKQSVGCIAIIGNGGYVAAYQQPRKHIGTGSNQQDEASTPRNRRCY